jgi:hypothetical protein
MMTIMNYAMIILNIYCLSFLLAMTCQAQTKNERYVTQDLNDIYLKMTSLHSEGLCTYDQMLIVFDLDDTLFTTNTEGINDLLAEILKKQKEKKPSCQLMIQSDIELDNQVAYTKQTGKKSAILLSVPKIRSTQQNAQELFDKIASYSPTMALTARYGLVQDLTESQVRFLNYDFHKKKPFKQLPNFHPQYFIILDNPQFPSQEVSHFLKNNQIHLKLKIHKSLLNLNQQGQIISYKMSLDIPLTENVKKYLIRNKKAEYVFLPSPFFNGAPSQDLTHFTLGIPHSPNVFSPLVFQNGILSSSNGNKGVILRSLLQHHDNTATKCVLFADDDEGRIQEMERAFAVYPYVHLFTFWYKKPK